MFEFSDALKDMRKSRGMTLQQVANNSGLAKSFIWELENGKSSICLHNAIKIATSFGMTIGQFLGEGATPFDPDVIEIAVRIQQLKDREDD